MLLIKKSLVLLTNCLIVSSAMAFPRGCEVTGFSFSENKLIVNEHGAQSFYLIQNRSDKKIELEHVETNPNVFMSPKLQAKFDPMSWSAFSSDVENMRFKCYAQQGSDRMVVNCRDALDICQYPRVKFALSNMGTYWISTNKPQDQVIKDAVAKGILLRW